VIAGCFATERGRARGAGQARPPERGTGIRARLIRHDPSVTSGAEDLVCATGWRPTDAHDRHVSFAYRTRLSMLPIRTEQTVRGANMATRLRQ
jgi:hypothetical protein